MPALKNFPTRYIHEPWTAPEAVQKSAKCIIGQDYPKPMCNHAYVSKLNMERMKQVYAKLANCKKTGKVCKKLAKAKLNILSAVWNECSERFAQPNAKSAKNVKPESQ